MRHLTGAVWAKLKPRTHAFRMTEATLDFLAGIVAAKGKTFVHRSFDLTLFVKRLLCGQMLEPDAEIHG